jgi:DNA-binding response OmpR family regulator
MDDTLAPHRHQALERVLLAAHPADGLPALAAEAGRRGAEVETALEVADAAQAVRARRFDAVLLAARPEPDATALLAALLKAEGRGRPRIVLLVDVSEAHRYGAAMLAADETVAAHLPARRICDTAGVGLTQGFQRHAAFG